MWHDSLFPFGWVRAPASVDGLHWAGWRAVGRWGRAGSGQSFLPAWRRPTRSLAAALVTAPLRQCVKFSYPSKLTKWVPVGECDSDNGDRGRDGADDEDGEKVC